MEGVHSRDLPWQITTAPAARADRISRLALRRHFIRPPAASQGRWRMERHRPAAYAWHAFICLHGMTSFCKAPSFGESSRVAGDNQSPDRCFGSDYGPDPASERLVNSCGTPHLPEAAHFICACSSLPCRCSVAVLRTTLRMTFPDVVNDVTDSRMTLRMMSRNHAILVSMSPVATTTCPRLQEYPAS